MTKVDKKAFVYYPADKLDPLMDKLYVYPLDEYDLTLELYPT